MHIQILNSTHSNRVRLCDQRAASLFENTRN